MAKRRALLGTSLLVGSGCMVVASCVGTSGNLVAPPMVELCVTVDPPEAEVLIDDTGLQDDGCNSVWEGTHTVRATADGFEPHEEILQVAGDTDHDIVMTPESTTL